MPDKYGWRPGARTKVTAQVAGEFLEELTATNGGSIKAADVVEHSRPPTAPLHEEFEWNNEIAGDLYREDQARSIIRHVCLIIPDEDKPGDRSKDFRPRNYFTLPDNNGNGQSYYPMRTLLTSEEARIQKLGEALRDLQRFQKRYADLKELISIFDETDRLAALLG